MKRLPLNCLPPFSRSWQSANEQTDVPREICNPETSLFSHEWIARCFLPEPDVTGHVSSYWRSLLIFFLKTAPPRIIAYHVSSDNFQSKNFTRSSSNATRINTDPPVKRRRKRRQHSLLPFERIFFSLLSLGEPSFWTPNSLEKECFNWRHRPREGNWSARSCGKFAFGEKCGGQRVEREI